ncbi:MAG: hypothetical protein DHS20C01_08630 [marine bacterium B5-7]|nr:MAG: hypothetical protein DHS20C01_08630 [marine bacterium B5-7]
MHDVGIDCLNDTALFRQCAYIDGSWLEGSGSPIEVTNPVNGARLGSVARLDAGQSRDAVVSAAAAFKVWSLTITTGAIQGAAPLVRSDDRESR